MGGTEISERKINVCEAGKTKHACMHSSHLYNSAAPKDEGNILTVSPMDF